MAQRDIEAIAQMMRAALDEQDAYAAACEKNQAQALLREAQAIQDFDDEDDIVDPMAVGFDEDRQIAAADAAADRLIAQDEQDPYAEEVSMSECGFLAEDEDEDGYLHSDDDMCSIDIPVPHDECQEFSAAMRNTANVKVKRVGSAGSNVMFKVSGTLDQVREAYAQWLGFESWDDLDDASVDKFTEGVVFDDGDTLAEADYREALSHGLDIIGVKASTANLHGQDEVELTVAESLEQMKKRVEELEKRLLSKTAKVVNEEEDEELDDEIEASMSSDDEDKDDSSSNGNFKFTPVKGVIPGYVLKFVKKLQELAKKSNKTDAEEAELERKLDEYGLSVDDLLDNEPEDVVRKMEVSIMKVPPVNSGSLSKDDISQLEMLLGLAAKEDRDADEDEALQLGLRYFGISAEDLSLPKEQLIKKAKDSIGPVLNKSGFGPSRVSYDMLHRKDKNSDAADQFRTNVAFNNGIDTDVGYHEKRLAARAKAKADAEEKRINAPFPERGNKHWSWSEWFKTIKHATSEEMRELYDEMMKDAQSSGNPKEAALVKMMFGKKVRSANRVDGTAIDYSDTEDKQNDRAKQSMFENRFLKKIEKTLEFIRDKFGNDSFLKYYLTLWKTRKMPEATFNNLLDLLKEAGVLKDDENPTRKAMFDLGINKLFSEKLDNAPKAIAKAFKYYWWYLTPRKDRKMLDDAEQKEFEKIIGEPAAKYLPKPDEEDDTDSVDPEDGEAAE